jgi:hypothetical protein
MTPPESKSNLSGFVATFRRGSKAESLLPSTWTKSKPKPANAGGSHRASGATDVNAQ